MTFTRTALFLALALSASTAFAQQDISKVNGSITAEAGQAYGDAVARLMGEERPMRFTTLEKKGFFSKLFGG